DPHGSFICVTLYEGPPAVIDIATGREIRLGENGGAAAVSPDGTIAIGHSEIEIWSPAGEKLTSTNSMVGSVNHLAFNPDGTALIAAGDREAAQLWLLKEDKSVVLPHSPSDDDTPLAVTFGLFNPQGTLVATAGKDRTIRI